MSVFKKTPQTFSAAIKATPFAIVEAKDANHSVSHGNVDEL